MKRKIFSLIVILIVAICGGVFVGCGKLADKDISISINSGLDAQEDVFGLGEKLFLTENELVSLKNGNSFNNTVPSGTAVSLVVGSEKYSTREIVVETKGVENAKIFFSTDSQAISISEVEYLSNGRAKVLISAKSAGTAEVYVQTGEYSKTTSFIVKVFEPLENISVKTGAVIYLEKGKTVELDSSSLVNFYPSSSNLTEVEFWDGGTCLTQNGRTILSTEENENATGIISESKEISIKSLRLPEGSNVQTLKVVVVDNLKEVKKEKMIYGQSFQETFEEIGDETLTVIRNVQTENGINYGVRKLKVSVKCEENLEIVSKIFDKNGNSLNISVLPISKKQTSGVWEFVFEFKYEGYSSYKVEFEFRAGQYVYDQKTEQNVDFKTASNMIEFKKAGDEFENQNNTYNIYDWYQGSIGTRFVVSTNKSDEIKNAQISLDVSNAIGKINVFNITGEPKEIQEGIISLNNNENFYISAVDGETADVELVVKVSYVFENITFETQKTITLKPQISPTSFNFVDSNNQTKNSFVFDLNTSGQIVSGFRETEEYSQRNSINLFLKGFVGFKFVGDVANFEIISNSSIVNIKKNGKNEISVVALKPGSGTFEVVLENGVSNTFTFTVIESVSSATAFLPTPEQNSNIISIVKNYNHNGTMIYDQYAILKTNTEVPLIISISGSATNVQLNGGEDVSYLNGKLKTNKDLTNIVEVSISFQYVKNNAIETKTVVFQKILITSIINIESFTLKDGNGKTTIECYDYNTVGHMKSELSKATLYLNVAPDEIEKEMFKKVKWATNIDVVSETGVTVDDDVYVLKTKAFTLTYYRTGQLAGTAEISCLVEDQSLIGQRITISASLPERFANGGVQTKTINLKIKQAEKVELISTNIDEIHLDNFVDEVNLLTTTYPISATNPNVKYVFIPKGALTEDSVEIVPTQKGATVILNSSEYGEGILRIIALDSYSNSTQYSVYLDIPLTISNGSAAYPYYINSSSDIIKLVETKFAYFYYINGEINVESYNDEAEENKKWLPSKFDLTGKIVGVNDAKITGITIDQVYEETLNSSVNGISKYIYAGLFKTIKNYGIENVAFDIKFDLNLSGLDLKVSIVYVGGLAGIAENNTSLKNVSVNITNITNETITVRDSYSLYFGGVVGKNSGTIINDISEETIYPHLVNYSGKLSIVDVSESPSGSGHTLYVGGAVGENAGGRIERKTNGLAEYNNGFATAKVNLEVIYTIISPDFTNAKEGIGGIVGINNTASTDVVESNRGLFNVSACGRISASGFDNVGGIVGNNESKVSGAQSQVFVTGKNNVGGAVGTNSGTLESILVENLKTNNGEKVLISGINNVGGIVGVMSGGSLTSSSFISYISSTGVDLDLSSTGGDTSSTGGDASSTGGDTSSTVQYGMIVGNQTDGTINHVVAVADTNAKGENEFFPTSNNFAIYTKKDFSAPRKSAINVVAGIYFDPPSLQELKEVSKFEFIYLPTDEINLELTAESSSKEMETDEGNLAFYLFYHNQNQENNIKNIQTISSLLTTDSIKSLMIESDSNNILEISGGNIILKGTGVVTLTASSPYIADSSTQTIYVYIVNYADSFEASLDSNEKEKIESNGRIKIDASENQFIYFNFLGYNENNYVVPKDVKVKIEILDSDKETVLKTIKSGESYELDGKIIFTLIQITPTSYQIVVNEKTAELIVNIVPYLEFVGPDGKTYSGDLSSGDLSSGDLSIVKVEINFVNSTKSLDLSKSTIKTEPYYTSQVDVTFNSLAETEKLTITVLDKYGNVNNNILNIIYNDNNINTIYPINCVDQNVYKIYFELKDKLSVKENLELTILFESINGKTATLEVVYEPQEVFSVNTALYPIQSQENEYGFNGSFSYIPSGVIVPGQNSLIEFSINPNFTYFDTVEIINASGNEYNLVFDLFNRTLDEPVAGIKTTTNGISIPQSLINNGSFALRTFLDHRISDNSNVSIMIIFKDKNGNQIGKIFEKTFYVEKLPGVTVTVDGVTSGSPENSDNNRLKLAQGLTYDLDVWVKGYNFGEFLVNESTATDGQIVLQVVGNTNLISIIKNNDGTYQLVVNSEIATNESRHVQINAYGINSFGERSQETTIYLEIVQFVVKAENVGDIIKDVVNNVYSSATGNSYTFEIALNSNIVIYDKTNEKILNAVDNFLNNLTTQGLWSFSENNGGWQPIKETNRNFTGSGVNLVYETREGIFKILYNTITKKITVRFLKTESSAVPTMQVQYYSDFYYNNGLPTVGTPTDSTNVYFLAQTISFDISEKTTLRNPYPIYSVEELMDMREGNYYILMNDIELPENFTPISTLIGGFDGNNYSIKISNISLQSADSTSLMYGLFQTTAEDSILKNIVLEIDDAVYISLYNFGTVKFGLLAAENNGQITNCRVVGTSQYSIVNLNLYGTTTSTTILNDVGGLVAINKGDITNCQIEAGIAINSVQNNLTGYLTANLGGLVAINQGSIASCYVKARIENNTAGSVSAITGGVVAENQNGATIFATYISGEETFPDKTELANATNIVYSTAKAGGFVYSNNGEISNCFSNIPVVATDGASGFVYNNSVNGLISKCYSTSALENSAKNGSFIGLLTGVVENENPILNSGILEECYSWTSSTNGNVNSGLGMNNVDGLKLVEKAEFRKQKDETGYLFEKFVFSTTSIKTDGVWFWGNGGEETQFLREGKPMSFSSLAPQLVSPNILARGSQELKETIFNEETQTTTYLYEFDENHQEGTKYNPYVIATEEDLEFMVSQQSGFTNGTIIKNIYCRLLCDIIYETSTSSSGLFKYSFLGSLEGNGYTIGNYVLDSSAKISSAGFFASLGTLTNQGGTIKNITFAPRYMSLTNCNAVGAVAGSAYGSTLVNINIDGELYSNDSEGVTIIGKNAVGGLVGIAEGSFNFNNIISNISTNSSYRSSLNGHSPVKYGGTINKVSYSGLIAGIINGYGEASYIEVGGSNVSVAEFAGLVFGYVGKNVVVSTINVQGEVNQSIKADLYGGVVAGHNSGVLKEISIIGSDDPSYNGFFAYANNVPIGIGNLVGFMSGGVITNAKVKANIIADSGVEALGGAVGEMVAGEIDGIKIEGNITGGRRIGGLVGYVQNEGGYKIIIKGSSYSGNILSNSSSNFVAVGTTIGYISNYSEGIVGEGGKIQIDDVTAENVNVRVITYSTSPSTEIMVGEIVAVKPDLVKVLIGNNGEVQVPDENEEYTPNTNDWYIPLADQCKINRVQWKKEGNTWEKVSTENENSGQ